MSIWTNLRNFFQAQSKATTQINQAYAGNPNSLIGWNSSGMNYSRNAVLNSNEEVFSVITRISNILASLPIHEYKNYAEKDDSLISLIRNSPNPNQSGYDLINQVEVSRNKDGNGYIWIERDVNQQPIALWPIDAGSVIVKRNLDDDTIWYQVNDDVHHFLIFNTDMIHVKHITPMSNYVGISPIDVLTKSLQFQRSVEDFSLSEMKKKDQYVITLDHSISDEKRAATLMNFKQMVVSNGGAVLLDKGMRADHYQSTFKPADLQTTEAISRARIANAFNVPLSFLNDGASKSTTNVEHVMSSFVETTLIPIVRQYESEFNRKLLTQNQRARGFYFKFNVNGLLRGDTAARTQFYQTLIRNGIATQNEIRKLEDLPPVAGEATNTLWVSKDLYPSENQLHASNIDVQTNGDDDEQKPEEKKLSSDEQKELNSRIKQWKEVNLDDR